MLFLELTYAGVSRRVLDRGNRGGLVDLSAPLTDLGWWRLAGVRPPNFPRIGYSWTDLDPGNESLRVCQLQQDIAMAFTGILLQTRQ